MSSAAPDKAQQVLFTTGGQQSGECNQLLPAKREHDDEVQFISSQPIKKMRFTDDEQWKSSQITAPSTFDPPPGAHMQCIGSSISDRSISSMPLRLPSHLSIDPLREVRGTSLPAMENFRFPSMHALTSAPALSSAAVSPRQLPQLGDIGFTREKKSGNEGLPSDQGLTIDQVSCLDVREPFNPVNTSLVDNFSNTAYPQNPNISNEACDLGTNTVLPTMPVANAAGSLLAGHPMPSSSSWQSGYRPMNAVDNQSFAEYQLFPANNVASLPRPSYPLGPYVASTSSPGIPELSLRQARLTGVSTGVQVPDRNRASPTSPAIQNPLPVRPPQEPISSVIARFDAVSSQPVAAQRPPCLACLLARQNGQSSSQHVQSHAQHHGPSHGNLASSSPQPPSGPGSGASQWGAQPSSAVMATTNRGSLQRGPHHAILATAPSSSTDPYPPFAGTRSSVGVRSEATQQSGHSHLGGGTLRTSAQNSFGYGTIHSSGQSVSSVIPIFNPTPPFAQNLRQSFLNRPTNYLLPLTEAEQNPASSRLFDHLPIPAQTGRQTLPYQPRQQAQQPQRPPQHNSQPKPRARAQQRTPSKTPNALPQPHQKQQNHHLTPPAPTSATTALSDAAAALASARKTHASNLLVDLAELVGEIFPYDAVARQHGTLPRKVAEALAVVVQVPLLRCATDKRRAGKLGSDRMREFREARKGWLALVREWEREDRGRDKGRKGSEDDGGVRGRDAKGETDDEVVGGQSGERGGAVAATAKGGHAARRDRGEQGKGQVDPRAVVQPGEPSALDVALLLPPAEMPTQMLREGFFPGPW